MAVMRANRSEEGAAEAAEEEVAEEAVEALETESAPAARQLKANDIAIQKGGDVVESIIRYHTAMKELTNRRGIRDDVSRYEAVALALVDSNSPTPGTILTHFPPPDSPLRIEHFFQTRRREVRVRGTGLEAHHKQERVVTAITRARTPGSRGTPEGLYHQAAGLELSRRYPLRKIAQLAQE